MTKRRTQGRAKKDIEPNGRLHIPMTAAQIKLFQEAQQNVQNAQNHLTNLCSVIIAGSEEAAEKNVSIHGIEDGAMVVEIQKE